MPDVDLVAIRDNLARLGRKPEPADVAQALRDRGRVVSDASVLNAIAALRRDADGAGALQPLLERPGVTDVLVNGPGAVYIDQGQGLIKVDVDLGSEQDVRALAVRIAALAGRRLDDAHPYVDSRLADGTRVHAVLAPVAQPGPILSLRVPARRRLSLDDWVDHGSITSAGAELLRRIITCKLAFLISGGTGTGKTTLLGALLGEIAADERLVVVEDSKELLPDHSHCVWLEARPANAEGAGEITLTTLVRQALRMRPDRLVLGEVRGPEVIDLLVALNTGHEGGCGTVHANSASDLPARLEALGSLAGLSREAIAVQAAAALDLVIHVVRDHGIRRVSELHLITSSPAGLSTIPALRFHQDGIEFLAGSDRLRKMLR